MSFNDADSFTIETAIKPVRFEDLLKFIQQTYVLPYPKQFDKVRRWIEADEYHLAFRYIHYESRSYVDVHLRAREQVQCEFVLGEGAPEELVDELKQDIEYAVRLFEDRIRQTSLYFSWVEGEEGIPERKSVRGESTIHRIFSDSMLPFFVAFAIVNIIFFLFFGFLAVFVLIAVQFVFVLFAARIVARTAEWEVTEKKPYVHLFQYQLPIDEYIEFARKFPEERLMKIKQEIYDQTLAQGRPVDCDTVERVLAKYGFICNSDNTATKEVNVYEIVKTAANRFKLLIPRIVISNSIIPNAAAAGPSPSHGVIVITTGLLDQLSDEEILGVIGHEFSHLKSRDPLVLFGLSAGEFALRLWVFFYWMPWIWFFFPLFGYSYLIISLGIVYFIAKFFEARADLDAAVKIGQPKMLAEALRKIGFRRIQLERIHAFRVREWTGLDPHPPLYFRIGRLESLKDLEKVKHPLLRSIKDNIRGFFAALRHRG